MLIHMGDNVAWAAIYRALEELGRNSRVARIPKNGTTLNTTLLPERIPDYILCFISP